MGETETFLMPLSPAKPRLCPYCGEEFLAAAGQISQCPGCGKMIVFRDEIGIIEFEKGDAELTHHADLSGGGDGSGKSGGGDLGNGGGPPSRPPEPFWLITVLHRFFRLWQPYQVRLERFFIDLWPAWLLTFTQAERHSLRNAIRGTFRITQLHDTRVAKWLASTGSPVPLQGLTDLSPQVARQLVKSADSLWLTGLESFCTGVANHFSCHRGRTLYLDGLRTLPDSVAEILVQHRGRGLSLGGLTSLPESTAEILTRYRGRLFLNGLTELSPGLAAILAEHRGPSLSLNGLHTLDRDVAAHLSQSGGDLSLRGIADVSGILTTIFRDFPGKIILRHHEIRPRRKPGNDTTEQESVKPLYMLAVLAAIIVLSLIAVLSNAMAIL